MRKSFAVEFDDVQRLERGEEGHKFVGRSGSGRLLATVLAREDGLALESTLAVCARIAALGEPWIVPRVATVAGSFVGVWGEYGLLLRRFVEGRSFDALTARTGVEEAAGRVLGRLHACSRRLEPIAGVADESDRRIRDEMAETLALAEGVGEHDPRHGWARELVALRGALEELAAATDALRRSVDRVRDRWVVTHGNATASNLILGDDGEVVLIDWSTMCLAPAERDLLHFVGPNFEQFLRGYRAILPADAVDRDVFDYYLHRWWTDGVTYFGKRLFAGEPNPESDARTRAVLGLFVPQPASPPAVQLRRIGEVYGWRVAQEPASGPSARSARSLWERPAGAGTSAQPQPSRRPGSPGRADGGRALRILQVAPYSARAWSYGGIPRVVGALARGLARRGHEVTVVTSDANSRAARLSTTELERSRVAAFAPNAEGYDQRIFRNLSNRLAYDAQFFLPLGMRGFIDRNVPRFDLAHVHAFRNLPATWAALACRRTGTPFLVTPNGTGPLIERRRVAKRIYDVLFRRVALRDAQRILPVTEVETRDLLKMGIAPERLTLVPNPLDLDEFEPEVPPGRLRARLGLGDAPLVLYLGRLSPRKRLDTLVRAFARLSDPRAQLVIAGSDMGALESTRREVESAGVGARVHFPGLLLGRERLEALRDADVVAYASEDEIFGLVPFEALLVGSPVVVADDSGCGELVRRTGGGRLVRPGDVPALAAALREILESPAGWRREALTAAGRVRAELGVDPVCARLEAAYFSVLERAPGAQFAAP